VKSGMVHLYCGLALLTAVFPTATSWAIDVDGDTYDSASDCFDRLYSAYKNAGICLETATPTFYDLQDTPSSLGYAADHAYIQDPSVVRKWHMYTPSWSYSIAAPEYIRHFSSTDDLLTMGPEDPLNTSGLRPHIFQGMWDYRGMWAPHVIQGSGGLYYMFYTGIWQPTNWTNHASTDPSHIERIGLTVSADLVTWTKVPQVLPGTTGNGCVYEARAPWTEWGNPVGPDGNPVNYDYQCRDPFVIKHPTENRWFMFVTVKMKESYLDPEGLEDPENPNWWKNAIHVSTSTDLINWSASGWIKATARYPEAIKPLQRTGGTAENPFVAVYNGMFYLFFTDTKDGTAGAPPNNVQYATSTSLTFDGNGSLNWVFRGAIPPVTNPLGSPPYLAVNAPEVVVPYGDTWFLSTSVSSPGPPFSYFRQIVLRRIVWDDLHPGYFALSNLTNLSCRVPSREINPGVAEICCDGLDNNCKYGVDESCVCTSSQWTSVIQDPSEKTNRDESGILLTASTTKDLWIKFSYNIPIEEQASTVKLEIFDLMGRRIRALIESKEGAGLRETKWDRRTESGSRAEAGVYFVRLTTASCCTSRKFVVTK
jgi:hypothetical protein